MLLRLRTTALLLAVLPLLLAATSDTTDGRTWAPAGAATIHPGVQTVTDGAQCTASFVFTRGSDVLLGQAAHCAGTGGATDTDGCSAGSLPLGTRVAIRGAAHPGTLVYSSWLAMQAAGERRDATCRYNDFALVRIDPRDVARVNPSVPSWGGPTALGDATALGEHVHSYGNSSLRLGLSRLSPKKGVSLGTQGDGWVHRVYTGTPGVPGDSGSGFLDRDGRAFGTLSTLALAPLAGSNGVTDLRLALDYAALHGFEVTLEPGTEPFAPLG